MNQKNYTKTGLRECKVSFNGYGSGIVPVCDQYDDGSVCDICKNLADPGRTTEEVRGEIRKIKGSKPNIIEVVF
jgi:hypothetical protein